MRCPTAVLGIVLTLISWDGVYSNATHYKGEEREALLDFKHSLTDPSNHLSSWVGDDCCKWTRVRCHNTTSHVIHLNLPNFFPIDDYESFDAMYKRSCLGGNINGSLLQLKHLQHLDLSDNCFLGQHIPQFVGSLTNLTYLNLSSTGFMGPIPPQLGSMLCLDIGRDDYLYIADDLIWISHLSSIEFLDMTYVNLNRASNNGLQMMYMLPSLSTLHLSLCFLSHQLPLSHVNFSSLVSLDLSYNSFMDSSTLGWLSSIFSIVSLDLSYNRILGLLPALLRNLTTLRFLNLAYNQFNSAIPKVLYDMTSLQILDLKYNNFQGSILGAFANLTSLTELQLSSNYFEGQIPRSLGNPCNLRILGLSLNQLSGDISEFFGDHSSDCASRKCWRPIPVSIGKLSSLRRLDISSNLFNGSIPETLGSLSKLERVFISNNSFEDIISEVHFANLTSLKYFARLDSLYSEFTEFQTEVRANFHILGERLREMNEEDIGEDDQMELSILALRLNNLNETIPTQLYHLYSLQILDLANNSLSGTIPKCLGNYSAMINKPHFFNQFLYNAKSRNLEKMPLVLKQFMYEFSNSLEKLTSIDLSCNNLYGEIPIELTHLKGLLSLNLSINRLQGRIPEMIGNIAFTGVY
ncbi:receptor-like protein EIX1 [Malania oleifera]|uniref:receptor-like protein EIX1 n=1 Tax=Malania oleifera TaxID=397392 RepID=UPI0025AE5865|nr:receptor-like protein EIX1 [Malania oleifera]